MSNVFMFVGLNLIGLIVAWLAVKQIFNILVKFYKNYRGMMDNDAFDVALVSTILVAGVLLVLVGVVLQ